MVTRPPKIRWVLEFTVLALRWSIATYGRVRPHAMGLVVTYTTSGIFNFAQGAMGMIGAVLYGSFEGHFGWPSWAAFILVAFVLSPLGGAAIEVGPDAPPVERQPEAKLTVHHGLLLFSSPSPTGGGNPEGQRVVPQFFNGKQVSTGA